MHLERLRICASVLNSVWAIVCCGFYDCRKMVLAVCITKAFFLRSKSLQGGRTHPGEGRDYRIGNDIVECTSHLPDEDGESDTSSAVLPMPCREGHELREEGATSKRKRRESTGGGANSKESRRAIGAIKGLLEEVEVGRWRAPTGKRLS